MFAQRKTECGEEGEGARDPGVKQKVITRLTGVLSPCQSVLACLLAPIKTRAGIAIFMMIAINAKVSLAGKEGERAMAEPVCLPAAVIYSTSFDYYDGQAQQQQSITIAITACLFFSSAACIDYYL